MNEDTRMMSTSGGVFSAIAELVLRNTNSWIYGALYDDEWNVFHMGIDSLTGLDRLRQSKYVQSNVRNCYSEIHERLERNDHVLFCGTPCQVDGLRLFLGKDYEKMWLVDIVCHGVTSPVLFKQYVRDLEKKNGAHVKMFRFRDKVSMGNISSLAHTTVVFENGKTRSSECDLYLRGYMAGLMQRVSCEKCPYASRYRRSDVTLGDFWGIEDVIPSLKDQVRKGISLILCNTDKGHEICGQLTAKMYLVETELSHALNGKNGQLIRPVQANSKKRQLYSDVKRMGIQLALARALGLPNLALIYYGWCKNRVKAYLPNRVYRCLVFLRGALRQLSARQHG